MSEEEGFDLPDTAAGVVFSAVEEGAVLLSTEDEVYYGLNDVGADIWQGLDEEDTLDGLCARLLERYPDVDPDVLRADVLALLEDLSELGLLEESDVGSDPDEGG